MFNLTYSCLLFSFDWFSPPRSEVEMLGCNVGKQCVHSLLFEWKLRETHPSAGLDAPSTGWAPARCCRSVSAAAQRRHPSQELLLKKQSPEKWPWARLWPTNDRSCFKGISITSHPFWLWSIHVILHLFSVVFSSLAAETSCPPEAKLPAACTLLWTPCFDLLHKAAALLDASNLSVSLSLCPRPPSQTCRRGQKFPNTDTKSLAEFPLWLRTWRRSLTGLEKQV